MSNKTKPKIAMYWAASCGGCEIALVNINEKILDLAANFDLVFCPCLMDTKKQDVESMADGEIDIAFFNGAIRTEENMEMAHLLRKKSKALIAFGACAKDGGIPSMANFYSRQDIFDTVYNKTVSTENPYNTMPMTTVEVLEGTLTLPALFEKVRTLGQVVDVDFFIPGCPPESHQIWGIFEYVLSGNPLPPKGSALGGGTSSVCSECKRVKSDKKIDRLYRTYEIEPEPEICLLEQGFLCMGVATMDGCGGLCPDANMPCTGCYGAASGVLDSGAKMIAALGSILDISELTQLPEEEMGAHIHKVMAAIPDFAGTFYKYTLANSIMKGNLP
jgi:F420-non-reducing hydrogenase small subunit